MNLRRRPRIVVAAAATVAAGLLAGGAWKLGWLGANGGIEERVFDLGNGVRMTFCWCPPGTFLMGSPVTEAGRRDNERQHEVTLTRGFWMAKTETTQAQWKALMAHNPSRFQGDRLPVESVTWEEAKAFAAALTDRMRREGKLDAGWEFRLPSEAQWEYACRAGTATAYYTGAGEAALRKAGWYNGNSERKPSRMAGWLRSIPVFERWFPGNTGGKTWPAGKKEENAFGLQDMHGNVWEWCEDLYGEYGEGGVVDPIGPREGPPLRVMRGGSWDFVPDDCRSAWRDGHWPGNRWNFQGFRVCLVPGPAGPAGEESGAPSRSQGKP